MEVEKDILGKFSYSKLATFEQCAYKYQLIYELGNYISSPTIATDFGTLLHYVEETMAKDIVANNDDPSFLLDPNAYDKYINLFIKGTSFLNDEGKEEVILGASAIKAKYPKEFYTKDKHDRDYEDKANDYLNFGIFRLRDFLLQNPDLRIVGIEKEFNLKFRDYVFHGFIDRVFKNILTGKYLVEDIKSWKEPKPKAELTTPLQLVIYTLAAEEIYKTDRSNIECDYELVICNQKQSAGTKGYIDRGLKKLNKLLDEIESKKLFIPKPCPLCHWCVFCPTYPNQPKEAKGLCPYFSHWTPENKTFEVEFEWMGNESNSAILETYKQNVNNGIEIRKIKPKFNYSKNSILKDRRLVENESLNSKSTESEIQDVRKFRIRW